MNNFSSCRTRTFLRQHQSDGPELIVWFRPYLFRPLVRLHLMVRWPYILPPCVLDHKLAPDVANEALMMFQLDDQTSDPTRILCGCWSESAVASREVELIRAIPTMFRYRSGLKPSISLQQLISCLHFLLILHPHPSSCAQLHLPLQNLKPSFCPIVDIFRISHRL